MATPLIFVKLGGSILTDKTRPESFNPAILQATAAVIAAFMREAQETRVLIGHGGGSFGHYWAERYATHLGVTSAEGWHGVARVADAMGRLNRRVVAALLDAGINAMSVQPSASALAAGGVLQQFETATLGRLLHARIVPVIYGDVVLDNVQGAAIASTEALFSFLAPRLQPGRIVLVGEAGVFTADPRYDSGARRIPEITGGNITHVLEQTGASHGTDVTGGMAAKVRQMWHLVQTTPGLIVQLVGADPAVVDQALRGQPLDEGTVIKA